MDTHVWLAYVVTAIVFSLAPGSGTVNSISNGLSYGTRKSLGAIVGLQIGLAIHIALVGYMDPQVYRCKVLNTLHVQEVFFRSWIYGPAGI